MSKEIEADKAAFDALLATGQGEEVMAVVPAGIEPGTVTIREGGLETEGQPETPAEQPETQPEEQETPPEQPESSKPGLIIWKGFPRKP